MPADGRVAYGVVVCAWWDEALDCWDHYVAFFGDAPPDEGQKPPPPHVLRYAETSLRPGWTD